MSRQSQISEVKRATLQVPRDEAENRIRDQPEGGLSGQKIEEIRLALRELGLDDDVSVV